MIKLHELSIIFHLQKYHVRLLSYNLSPIHLMTTLSAAHTALRQIVRGSVKNGPERTGPPEVAVA